MEAEIRVVIADDHPIVRQGLRQVIEREPGLVVVAEAGDGLTALRAIESLRPAVAVLDVDMPHLDGFGVAEAVIAARWPVALIFLTIHSEAELFQAALALGVKGYVLKDRAIEEVVTGIKLVAAGRHFTSLPLNTHLAQQLGRSQLSEPLQQALDSLTPTELRILQLLAEYRTSKEIAASLGVSVRTIETHRAHIGQKLDLHGSHTLLKFAVKHKTLL